jgi:hypothetical protein
MREKHRTICKRLVLFLRRREWITAKRQIFRKGCHNGSLIFKNPPPHGDTEDHEGIGDGRRPTEISNRVPVAMEDSIAVDTAVLARACFGIAVVNISTQFTHVKVNANNNGTKT